MSVSWLRILGLMVVSACLVVGCSGVKKIDVGGACILNSDCNQPLVCTMGKCHDACHTSADCPTGQSCIAASNQSTVCQLPAEMHCLYASDCQPPLECAVDQRCHNQCKTNADCPSGQTCTTAKACAEPNQVDINNNLIAPDGGVSGIGGVPGAGGAGGSAEAGAPDGPRVAEAGVPDAPGAQPDVSMSGSGGGAGGIGGGGGTDARVADAPGSQPDVSMGGSGGGAGGIGGGGGADARVADAPGAQPDVSMGGSGGGAGGIGGAGGADAGVPDAPGADATAGTGDGTSTGNPPGYYMTKDWNVTSVDWHGCVWTAHDTTVMGSSTSVTPKDFTAATTEGGSYPVTGTVFNNYNSFAMVGFNLNESVTGSSTQCAYDLSKSQADGPPAATMPGSATGIAFNWSRGQASTNFRIQIQSSDAYTNANHRWCAAIPDAGPSFIRFSDFYTQCWYLGTVNSPGTQYDGEPIDAVVFLVAGTEPQTTPFDFTISGFAPGTSAADAPLASRAAH